MLPCQGGVEASHGFGTQVAAESSPSLHEVTPLTVYPVSHVGWHVSPEASWSVQSPTPPFVTHTEASHELGLHVAEVHTPSVHEVTPLKT